MATKVTWLAIASIAAMDTALAASRGRYGGTLQIAVAGKPPEADPKLADAPAEASMLQLVAPGLCQLDRELRVHPILSADVSQPDPLHLKLTLKPNLQFPNGSPLSAAEVAASWARLDEPSAPSPYRALLFPLRSEGGLTRSTTSPLVLELQLSLPWPDLPASLCHPALGIVVATATQRMSGLGAFLPRGSPISLDANPNFPLGRPYLDRLEFSFGDERKSRRLFSLKQAQILVGGDEAVAESRTGPPLYATYLAFAPERVGTDFRQAFDSVMDRADLTRFFARSSSVPMYQLLPPPLMPQQPMAAAPSPSKTNARRELTLLYDQAQPEQRAVAERIQVKLHALGYRISLAGLSRAELRIRWASKKFDLMLHAILLSPVPSVALALLLELSGQHSSLAIHLAAIGAVVDGEARVREVRKKVAELASSLPLIPLYAQGLRVAAKGSVAGLEFDGQGLPELDRAFFGVE